MTQNILPKVTSSNQQPIDYNVSNIAIEFPKKTHLISNNIDSKFLKYRESLFQNINDYQDYSEELKKLIDKNNFPAIVCRVKNTNPNFLAIIHSNVIFQKTFHLEQADLINKNYDFLFEDIDLSYSSSDQIEFTKLILAIKKFQEHSSIITLGDFQKPQQKNRFNIQFIPQLSKDSQTKYALFIFKKIDDINFDNSAISSKNTSKTLLKSLERSLRNERLLREISNLIISDLSIDKIASSIAKIIVNNLKCDRCIIHDFLDNRINFAVEYVNNFSSKIINNLNPNYSSQELTEYISFQNNFYHRYGDLSKKTSITIVDNILQDPNFASNYNFFEKYFVVNQIAIPLIYNQKIIGNIFLHQSDKRTWLEDEIEMLEIIANQLTVAISRFFSIQKVLTINQELIQKSQELQNSLDKEHEMRRMQNEFIALVSHEFKTPLQIIDSTRENLSRKIKNLNLNDDAINKGFERIKTGVFRMNGLINSTLNLAKMENSESSIKVNLSQINLKKLLEDIIDKSKNLAQIRNIEIKSNISSNITDIISDNILLDHIFTNLISNAIKYSNPNGVVDISALIFNNFVEIKVIDYGIGIPQNDLIKIGDKFFRAKNSIAVAGTGIGIYLTKKFIELLNGKFKIESIENSKTVVTVLLPIALN